MEQFDEGYWEVQSGKVESDAMMQWGTRQSASPRIWVPTKLDICGNNKTWSKRLNLQDTHQELNVQVHRYMINND